MDQVLGQIGEHEVVELTMSPVVLGRMSAGSADDCSEACMVPVVLG